MLNVKDFRTERGLTSTQVVAVMREQYPGYDKYLNSKVENPERYGVRIVNDAERLLEEAFAKTAPEPRKRDYRRLPQRIQCRLSKTEYARLQRALRRNGFDTLQAGMTYIISRYLAEEDMRHGI